MFKRILMVLTMFSIILLVSGCQSKTDVKKRLDSNIYNKEDYAYLVDSTKTDVKKLSLSLDEKKDLYTINRFKDATITLQGDETYLTISHYKNDGKLKWEKTIPYNPNRLISRVIYFKEGIVFSYTENKTQYVVKYDHKGNEVWKLVGGIRKIYDEHGFFMVLEKSREESYALYLDKNGEIVYNHGPYIMLEPIGTYDDFSMLYYYKKENEPFAFVRIAPDGKILFQIQNANNTIQFENQELYISTNLHNILDTHLISKYNQKGNEVFKREGQFEDLHIQNKNTYLTELSDSKSYFVKYDSVGKQVFRSGPYDQIHHVDYLSEGGYILYSVLENEFYIKHLDSNGNLVNEAGPYEYNGFNSVELFRNITSLNEGVKFVTYRKEAVRPIWYVVGLDANLNEIFNETYDLVRVAENSKMIDFETKQVIHKVVFYKKGNVLGVVTDDPNGTLKTTILNDFGHPYFSIRLGNPIMFPYNTDSSIFQYIIEDSRNNSYMNKLIKVNQNGVIEWTMDNNRQPSHYFEYENGFILANLKSDPDSIELYDSSLNQIQEIQFNKNIEMNFDHNKFVITYVENYVSMAKVYDENFNVEVEGKIINTQHEIIGKTILTKLYYIQDSSNNIYEINLRIQ